MKKYKNLIIYGTDCDFPLYDSVDVLVCGGGPAGIAAAASAARRGQKTLLIERLGYLGGAAVAGYSGTICGAFLAAEDAGKIRPQQIVFGFTEQFLAQMRKNNGVTEPQLYGKTYLITHDPQRYKETTEGIVLDAGSQILYYATVFGIIKEADEFLGVVVDTKNGLAQIRAKIIIDATGDADIIYRSGYGYTMGEDGDIQNPTAIFRLSNVNMDTFQSYWGEDTISPDKITKKIQEESQRGEFLPRSKVWVFPTTRPGELLMNVTLITGRDGKKLNVCDPDDHTEAEILGRKQIRAYEKFFKKHIPGCEQSYINDSSAEIGVRQTRSIIGIERLTNEAVANAVKRPDGICRCPWPIELHSGEKPYLFWLINDYYEVPYGVLVPEIGERIIAAGRNICAEHQALASCRVTAQCFEYGHAAGIAADIAIRTNKKLREIRGEEVRLQMNNEGSRLG